MKESTVDHFEAPAAYENGSASIGVEPGSVSVDKREVLDGKRRMILILTHRSRPHLGLVAGILIKNSDVSRAAQCHFVAAVDDDFGPGIIEYFRRAVEFDDDWFGTAVERNDPTFGDSIDECISRATFGRTRSNDVIWFR